MSQILKEITEQDVIKNPKQYLNQFLDNLVKDGIIQQIEGRRYAHKILKISNRQIDSSIDSKFIDYRKRRDKLSKIKNDAKIIEEDLNQIFSQPFHMVNN